MKRGMTLVEFVVVALIIGFLVYLLIPKMEVQPVNSKKAKFYSLIWQIQSAMAAYHNDYRDYPYKGILMIKDSSSLEEPNGWEGDGNYKIGTLLRRLAPMDQRLVLGRPPSENQSKNYLEIPDEYIQDRFQEKIRSDGVVERIEPGTLIDCYGFPVRFKIEYRADSFSRQTGRPIFYSRGPNNLDETHLDSEGKPVSDALSQNQLRIATNQVNKDHHPIKTGETQRSYDDILVE